MAFNAKAQSKVDPELLAEAMEQYGRFMSLSDACAFLMVSSRTMKRLVAAGELSMFTIGSRRTFRVKTEQVVSLIREVA